MTEFAVPERWTFESHDVAKNFNSHVREQLPWYDLATNATSQIVRHYLPKSGTVYDFGCSTGNIGRAIEATLLEREAKLIPVDAAEVMRDAYKGPQPENLLIANALEIDILPFDAAVCFLVLMFMAEADRRDFVTKLKQSLKPGGVIVVLDRCQPPGGYLSIVTSRLTIAAKLAAGADPKDIIAKELSLGGVQRPISPAPLLGEEAHEWFRFGDFAGWIIESSP